MESYYYELATKNKCYLNIIKNKSPNDILLEVQEKSNLAIMDNGNVVAILLDIHEFYRYFDLIKYQSDYKVYNENTYFNILKYRTNIEDKDDFLEEGIRYVNENKWYVILKSLIPVAIFITINEFLKLIEIENVKSEFYDNEDGKHKTIDDSGFVF